MDDPNNTTDTRDETDEEILTYTVSDEAIEAAAAMRVEPTYYTTMVCACSVGGCWPD
jgi:hypothetical protein